MEEVSKKLAEKVCSEKRIGQKSNNDKAGYAGSG